MSTFSLQNLESVVDQPCMRWALNFCYIHNDVWYWQQWNRHLHVHMPCGEKLTVILIFVMIGVELTLFTVASRGLCFGFELKSRLIIRKCFCYCWAVLAQCQGLLCFSYHLTSEEPERAQDLENGHSSSAYSSWQQDVSYHMVSWWAIKPGGRGRKGGMFGVMTFVFPSNCQRRWSPAFLEIAEHPPAHGKWWMNSMFCFACLCGICFTC